MKALDFKQTRKLAKRGFTLIEILVATVIMIILVGLVIQITAEVLKVWNRSAGKLSANAEARIALDIITRDLETAVLRNNGQQWIYVEGPAPVQGSYNSNTVSLRLFSPALDRVDGPGDICGIAYRLEYKQSYTGASETYALYRAIETPTNTFNDLLGSRSNPSSPQLNISPSSRLTFWTNESIVADNNYLASNIVDFKIVIYASAPGTTNLNELATPFNADDEMVLNGMDYAYGGIDGQTFAPSYADVVLTIVSDEGLRLLERPTLAGSGFSTADDVVKVHGDVYTRRVHFLAKPL